MLAPATRFPEVRVHPGEPRRQRLPSEDAFRNYRPSPPLPPPRSPWPGVSPFQPVSVTVPAGPPPRTIRNIQSCDLDL